MPRAYVTIEQPNRLFQQLTDDLTHVQSWHLQQGLRPLPADFWSWLEDYLWAYYSPQQRQLLTEWGHTYPVPVEALHSTTRVELVQRWPRATLIMATRPSMVPILVDTPNRNRELDAPLLESPAYNYPTGMGPQLPRMEDICGKVHLLVRDSNQYPPSLQQAIAPYHAAYVAEAVFQHQQTILSNTWVKFWAHPCKPTLREWAHLIPEWVHAPNGPPGRPPSATRQATLMATLEPIYAQEREKRMGWMFAIKKSGVRQATWWEEAAADIQRLDTFAKMREAWLPMLTAYRLAGGQQP